MAVGTESKRTWKGAQKVHKGVQEDVGRAPVLSTTHHFSPETRLFPVLLTCVADYIYDFSKTK